MYLVFFLPQPSSAFFGLGLADCSRLRWSRLNLTLADPNGYCICSWPQSFWDLGCRVEQRWLAMDLRGWIASLHSLTSSKGLSHSFCNCPTF